MKKSPPKCVQCTEEMLESYGNSEWSAPFCNYPQCPNYGLLQTGINREEKEHPEQKEFNRDFIKKCPYNIQDCPKDK
jgi:hypothetical protein